METLSLGSATVSPKQVAKAIGVSESSLKRWCDRGLIPMSRTEGGHRRLNPADVVAFIRNSDRQLAEPEILGLPASSRCTIGSRTVDQLTRAFIEGKDELCRRMIFDLYLGNEPLDRIFDDVIARSFYEIGVQWHDGRLDIFQERRATEICESILLELRAFLPVPATDAPCAIGATPEGDDYRLANRMAELILRDLGWNAISLGVSLPLTTIQEALKKYRPQLLWLSISAIDDEQKFFRDYRSLREAVDSGVAIVIGGKALTKRIRDELRYTAYCAHMHDMQSCAREYCKN